MITSISLDYETGYTHGLLDSSNNVRAYIIGNYVCMIEIFQDDKIGLCS